MTAATVSFGTASPSPSNVSLSGLDGVNFFLAGILAGFGPYLAAYLADQKWTQENIGFVLTASGVAGLLSQLPGGELLDTVRSKRAVVVAGGLFWGARGGGFFFFSCVFSCAPAPGC